MQRSNQQGIDRQPGRTAHERRNENRYQAILWALNGACGHDSRDGAGEGAEHGYEAFAVKSDFAHEPVHEESRSRHIARVFQKTDEEEEQENLR